MSKAIKSTSTLPPLHTLPQEITEATPNTISMRLESDQRENDTFVASARNSGPGYTSFQMRTNEMTADDAKLIMKAAKRGAEIDMRILKSLPSSRGDGHRSKHGSMMNIPNVAVTKPE